MLKPGMVVLKTTTTRAEADIIAGVLESDGIECVIESDDAGQTNPELDFTRFVRVMVAQGDLARAQGSLSAAEERGEALPSRPEIDETP